MNRRLHSLWRGARIVMIPGLLLGLALDAAGSVVGVRPVADGDDVDEDGDRDDARRPTAILRQPTLSNDSTEMVDGWPVSAELATQRDSIEISLDEYVRLVIIRNLDLKIAELDNEQARTGIDDARAAFDPELFVNADGSDNETPTASVFTASSNQRVNADTGFRGLMRTGASYGLTFATSYTRQKPSNPFFDFNPSMTSSVSLDLTQPLLRGAGSTVTESGLHRAQLLVGRGDLDLMNRVQVTAHAAVLAYWNLVFELRTTATASHALEVANEFVANTDSKLRAGIMTRLDLTRAEAEEKRREEELIAAQNRLAEAEDSVIALASPGEDLNSWNLTVVPQTKPRDVEAPTPLEIDAVQVALVEREDLQALGMDLTLADLELAMAENELLPRLDFRASYGLSGLSGQLTSAGASSGASSNEELFFDSLDPILDSQFERWTLGFQFSHPLGNRRARAGVKSARISKERALLAVNLQRQVIIRQVRTALRDVIDAWARHIAARESHRLAKEQYEAEEVRLRNEVATSFEVREAQRDMFEAADVESRAVLDYEIQLARLEQVQGRLAQRFGVIWEPEQRSAGSLIR